VQWQRHEGVRDSLEFCQLFMTGLLTVIADHVSPARTGERSGCDATMAEPSHTPHRRHIMKIAPTAQALVGATAVLRVPHRLRLPLGILPRALASITGIAEAEAPRREPRGAHFYHLSAVLGNLPRALPLRMDTQG
jgi:hypothetical protein